MTTIDLMAPIWERLMGVPFNASDLADNLIRDGGHDISALTKDDLLCLMEDRFQGKWFNVVFSFSELLTYYAACELTNVQVVAWCFSALIIGKAARKLETDWEHQLYFLAIGFTRVKPILTYDEFVVVLTQAFSPYDDVNKEGRPNLGSVLDA